ncbi:MAG: 3D domain-containing protein [Butyrivibrio sp.]|nr:3D domain-containing protein [Butyrivibrio sp.]
MLSTSSLTIRVHAQTDEDRLRSFGEQIASENLMGDSPDTSIRMGDSGDSGNMGGTAIDQDSDPGRIPDILRQIREIEETYGPQIVDRTITTGKTPGQGSTYEVSYGTGAKISLPPADSYILQQQQQETSQTLGTATAQTTGTAATGLNTTDTTQRRITQSQDIGWQASMMNVGTPLMNQIRIPWIIIPLQIPVTTVQQTACENPGDGEGFPTTDWQRFGTELVPLGEFKLTAYDPCLQCCGKTDGITATGTQGFAGRTIAVDPSVIPYGSHVVIGDYVFVAEDTGGAIRGKHIDLFMNTHDIAKQFGVRQAEVYLIK